MLISLALTLNPLLKNSIGLKDSESAAMYMGEPIEGTPAYDQILGWVAPEKSSAPINDC